MWINEEKKKLQRILPSQFYIDPAELFFGEPTMCSIKFRQYPLIYLKDKITGSIANHLDNDRLIKCTYRIFWDLLGGRKFEFVEGELIRESKIRYTIPPFSWVHYRNPVRGMFGRGLTDGNWWLQQKINSISDKLHKATELNAVQRTWVPDGLDEEYVGQSNRVGSILTYTPSGNISGPGVIVETPPPISDMYLSLLQFYYEMAFRGEGVSQLSAQSKLPGAADQSGKALDTMQDIESERFETQQKNYIDFQQRTVEVMIEVFPDSDDILPAQYNRSGIKWGDIKKNLDNLNIVIGKASSLSKDPSRAAQQIEIYAKMGLFDKTETPKYITMPDLLGAQSTISASSGYIDQIIENAATKKEYDFYEGVDLNSLYAATNKKVMQLATNANADDEPYIDNLKSLMFKIKSIQDQANRIINEQAQAEALKSMPPQNVPQLNAEPGTSMPPQAVPVLK
jgi:hypothetical protein